MSHPGVFIKKPEEVIQKFKENKRRWLIDFTLSMFRAYLLELEKFQDDGGSREEYFTKYRLHRPTVDVFGDSCSIEGAVSYRDFERFILSELERIDK